MNEMGVMKSLIVAAFLCGSLVLYFSVVLWGGRSVEVTGGAPAPLGPENKTMTTLAGKGSVLTHCGGAGVRGQGPTTVAEVVVMSLLERKVLSWAELQAEHFPFP